MKTLLLVLFVAIGAVFLGSSGAYYLYMKRMAEKPWGLSFDAAYEPSVAILVPVHNEGKIVQLKLRNLSRTAFAPEKTRIVVVNDASTDETLEEVASYKKSNPNLGITVLSVQEHLGKTACLNLALKSVTEDVVVVSDTDCFWPPDILQRALPFMSDSTVGAVTGLEWFLNPHSSWVTVGEQFFDKTVQSIRVGESKVHSTINFQGGFAAYKRVILDDFDRVADDSGTALNIIQKNSRSLLLPEIGFFTTFPAALRNKLSLKIRRASQLQRLWFRCLSLMAHGKLRLPKRIAISEIFLHIFNPFLLVALSVVAVFVFAEIPATLAIFVLFLLPVLLVKKTRTMLLEVLQNNLILLAALSTFITNKGFILWKTVQESRLLITEEVLKQRNLI